MPARTLVIGIGNPLQSDDGVGVHAVNLLANESLPAGVQIEELGTPGWGLLAHMDGWQRVFVVDAVRMGQPPGTWRRFGLDEVCLVAGAGALSLHEPGLAESLELASTLGLLPDEVVLYGVEPAQVKPGEHLSPAVHRCIPDLVEHIVEELWKGI